MTVRSQTAPDQSRHGKQEDDSESDEDVLKPQKRKAATDCHNAHFSQSISSRLVSQSMDFSKINIQHVHSLNSGRPPQPRIELPAGVEVFQYS